MTSYSNLNENQIVDAVCIHLQAKGYDILSRCLTTDKGIDIIGKHPSEKGRLLIEAKGGTSTRETSARFDKGFNSVQVFDRVAKGFYTSACMISEYGVAGDTVALAFPDTDQFRRRIEAIKPALVELKIRVFLVSAEHTVSDFSL